MHRSTLHVLAGLGGIFFIGSVVLVNFLPPAAGYEISVYGELPPIFWISIVGAMVAGALLILGAANSPEDRSWFMGIVFLVGSNLILTLLPIIRGYQMYGRSDAMTHLGYVIDIHETGGIDGNLYPPLHIITMTLEEVTGGDPMMIGLFLPPLFSFVFFGGLVYLAIHYFDSRMSVLLTLPIVLLPVLRHAHLGFRPFDLSLMLLPIVLFLLLKAQQDLAPKHRVIFVVVLFGILLFHPLTALFVVILFIGFNLPSSIPHFVPDSLNPTHFVSLSAAIFLAWYSDFSGIISRFDRVYQTIVADETGDAPVDAYAGTVDQASPGMVDLIEIGVFRYGIESALIGLGMLFLGVLAIESFRTDKRPTLRTLGFGVVFIGFSVASIFFLVFDLIVPPERPLQIAKVLSVLFVGALMYKFTNHATSSPDRQSERLMVVGAVVCLICLLVTLSVFSMYFSPLASETNHQVTAMEVEGSEWLSKHGTAAEDLSEFGMRFHRFSEAQGGTTGSPQFWGETPPDHFNYHSYEHLGDTYPTDRYLIITQQGRELYPELFPNYPENWRFSPDDFDDLERDESTDRIYDNGDFNLYFINAIDN